MNESEKAISLVLQDWAALVDAVLRENLRKRGARVPSATLERLRHQVVNQTYTLSFQDSGRIVDMKQLRRRKRPITSDENFILEWVKKRGLSAFQYVPGYPEKSRVTLSQEQQMSRIASGVIAAMGRNFKSARARDAKTRKWFNAAFYGLVDQLTKDLIAAQVPALQQEIVEPLRDALTPPA